MKTPTPLAWAFTLALLIATFPSNTRADSPSSGQVDFGKFSPPAAGGEFVEVNVKSNLIGMVARLAEKSEPDVAQLLRGLQNIRVNVIGLDDTNREDIQQRIKTIHQNLDSQNWERIVTVQKGAEDVGVFLKLRGEEAVEGLAITVMQGKKQAILINIVGNIRPEKVALIGERFNIEPLKHVGHSLETKPAPQP